MILFIDEFDGGADHPDFTVGGYYNINLTTDRWKLVKACHMFEEYDSGTQIKIRAAAAASTNT